MIIPTLPLPHHSAQTILDSTKLKCYQECPRKYFYEHVLGWRPAKPSNHLVFGQAVHLAMEHIILNGYNGNSVIDAMELFNKCYRDKFPAETDFLFEPKTPVRFYTVLVEYVKRYWDDLKNYEVYKTEIGGTVHLSSNPNHVLAWKMDTIMYNRITSMYFSLEHKSSQGNYWPNGYELDFKMGPQVGTYNHVLNSLFDPAQVEGITINGIKFKKTKKFEFLLQRFPIHMNNVMMVVWLEQSKAWIDTIYNDYLKLSEASPKDDCLTCFHMNGGACSNWGRICDYNDLCTSWQNPLQHLHQMPLTLEENFWNPLEEDLREKMEL